MSLQLSKNVIMGWTCRASGFQHEGEGLKMEEIGRCYSGCDLPCSNSGSWFVHVYTVHQFNFHFIVPTGALNIKRNLTL
jgi:hypothetical protein